MAALYASVGWTAYTATPEVLLAGLAGSTHIAAAHQGAKLADAHSPSSHMAM